MTRLHLGAEGAFDHRSAVATEAVVLTVLGQQVTLAAVAALFADGYTLPGPVERNRTSSSGAGRRGAATRRSGSGRGRPVGRLEA